MPASTYLQLSRKEVQALAKQRGIAANRTTVWICDELARLDSEAEAELEARRPPPGWLANYCTSAGTQLTPLLQALGLLGAALLACTDRGWRQAIEQFRSEETEYDEESLGGLWMQDHAHYHREDFWRRLDDAWNRALEHFQRCFAPQVLPRYSRLRRLESSVRGTATAVFTALTNGAWPELRALTARPCSSADLALLLDGVVSCLFLQDLNIILSTPEQPQLTDAMLQKLLSSCKELQRIDVRATRWPSDAALNLAAVATGSGCKLRELRVPGCANICAAVLDVAKTCPQLQILDLSGCSKVTADILTALGAGCPQLESVDLRYCKKVVDAGIAAIVQGCQGLRTVDLRGTSISDAGLATMLSSPLLTRLAVDENWCLASRGPRPQDRPVVTREALSAASQQYPHISGLATMLNVKLVDQDGVELYFKIRPSATLQGLMHAFCNRQGVSMGSIRFLFDGNRINQTQTPSQLDMVDGDIIDVMIEQQGFLAWAAPPAPTEPTAADQVLHGAVSANAFSPDEVAALMAAVAGPHAQPGRAEVVMARQLLSAAQCAALVSHSEQAFRASGDGATSWTLETSCAELSSLVGAAPVAALCALGRDALRESRPHAPEPQMLPLRIALRRRAAVPAEVVHFHRDARRVVLHLPLNGDFEGGSLLLALRGCELHSVPVAPGTGTAIDNATVHSCARGEPPGTVNAVDHRVPSVRLLLLDPHDNTAL